MEHAQNLDSRFQIELYKYAKSVGKKPSDLSKTQIAAIALKVRNVSEVFTDGTKAVKSLLKTKALKIIVPDSVYLQRKGICTSNRCGKAIVHANGSISCGQCGCSGAFMESALYDPDESCRLPEPFKLWRAHK